MAALGRKDIKVGVDVDRAPLSGLNRGLDDTSKRLDKTTRSAVGTNKAFGSMSRTFKKLTPNLVTFQSRIPVGTIGLLGTAAYNAAGGLVALAGALAPAAGTLGAVGPLATSYAQALGAVKLATGDLKQAIGDLNEPLDTEAKAWKRLSPEAQDFARTLRGMAPSFLKLQHASQEGLFPGLEKSVKSASKNLPVLEKVIGRTAEALGDLAEKAGGRLGSREWGKDLEVQGARNEVTIRRLGNSGLDLAEAFKDITLAAGPMVDRLTRWVGALTEGWKESANAARESGRLGRFFKDAGDTFFKTVRILRDLTVAFVNIGRAARRAFGNELLGGIERGAAGLRKWTESARGQRELVAIFTDIGERLKRVGGFIKDLFGDFRQMRAEGKSAGDALGQVFLTAVAKVIENVGELGVKFAKAFVRGFIDADVGGKLILAAFTLSKFGLLGRTVGAVFGAGFTQGASAKVGATGSGGGLLGVFSKLSPRMRAIGKGVLGAALVTGIGAAMSDKATFGKTNFFQKFQQGVSTLTLGLVPGLRSLDERMQAIVKGIADFQGQLSLDEVTKDWNDFSQEQQTVIRNLVTLHNEADKFKSKFGIELDADTPLRTIRRLSNAFNDLRDHTTASLSTVQRIARRNMRLIANTLGAESKRGRDALRKNFDLAADDIRSLVDSGLVTAERGSAAIRALFVKYLGTFGLKGANARLYLERGAGGIGFIPGSDQRPHSGRVLQRGGMVVPGQGSGDKVPLTAMVEPGERVFVLNRNATKHLEYLHGLNAEVPRFRQGGEVGYQSGGLAAAKRKIRAIRIAGPDGSLKAGAEKGLDRLRTTAIDKLTKAARDAAAAVEGMAGPTVAGVGSFDGKQVAKWIIPYLVYGRQHGWTGSVTSGFRSFAEQTAIYNSGVRPAAVPGTSNHEGSQYPRGAVDVSMAEQLAAILQNKPGPHLLEFAGAKDPVHFSHPHGGSYQAGGLVGMQSGGAFGGDPFDRIRSKQHRPQLGKTLKRTLKRARDAKDLKKVLGPFLKQMGTLGVPKKLLAKAAKLSADHEQFAQLALNSDQLSVENPDGTTTLGSLKGVNVVGWLAKDLSAQFQLRNRLVAIRDVIVKRRAQIARALKIAEKRFKALKQKAGKKDSKGKPADPTTRIGVAADALRKAGFRGDTLVNMLAIAGRESHWDPKAANYKPPDHSIGLWQINQLAHHGRFGSDAQLMDPYRNARAAKSLFDSAGYSPWKGGSYAEFLPAARDAAGKVGKPASKAATPGRELKALKALIPQMKTQKGKLDVGLHEPSTGVLARIRDLQGFADPKGKIGSPWPIGSRILGGSIFQTQIDLRDKGAQPATSDPGGAGAGAEAFDSGRADRLAELLGLERQRALIRDIEVVELLRSARQPPFAGVFHGGGTIPGPVGAERIALVQGGETVVPHGSGSTRPIYVIVQDGAVDPNKIRAIAGDETKVVIRRESRSVGRVPGIPT